MSDISIRTVTTLNADQRWIHGSAKPGQDVAPAMSITLDRSAFDLVTAFPNGFLPSGIVLGKITATGLYAPYVDANSNGTQTAAGFLLASIPMDPNSAATSDVSAALYWTGAVVEAFLPTGHGLDAAARTDLASWIKFT